MGRQSKAKLYQFVDALVAISVREMVTSLGSRGVTDVVAQPVARDIARGICFQYARTVMYVPVDMEFDLSLRDQQIWEQYGQDGPDGVRKFTPQRVAQVAELHKLTVAHIYCIVKLMQKREVESRQGHLPGFGEPPKGEPA